ncbi:hypothetical protein LCGC14_2141800 [marine sediment metagenome]|uniref:Uncharacterized protein n=1 Tax=marine sediment metagenome TaxID=412755 RepID=A0A0F9DY60_9ZZZZ
MTQAVENINIRSQDVLVTPKALKEEIPITDAARKTITEGRSTIQNILDKQYITYYAQTVTFVNDSTYVSGRGRAFTLGWKYSF